MRAQTTRRYRAVHSSFAFAADSSALTSAQIMGGNARLHEGAPEFFLRNRQSGESELDLEIGDDVRRRSIESLGEDAYERALLEGGKLTTSQLMDLVLGRSKAKT